MAETHFSQLKNIMLVFVQINQKNLSFNPLFLRSHNWRDAECLKILTGVRKAMDPHSRVLVRESS